jgi:phosphoribosylamine--glycine ligase
MNILSIDHGALALDWVLRCVAAGHDVKLYTKGTRSSHIGDGLVTKVDTWEDHVPWADLIFVADNMESMDKIQSYIDKGYPVFGPGSKSARLELDRMYGQKVIEDFGGSTIPSHPFTSLDKAIQFVKDNPGRWVSKPIGEEEDKSLSYVAKDEADMIGFLTKRKKSGKGSKFILQEFKPGTEFAVTGVFGPGGFSKYFTEGFEHKKLMDGELGANTGEMGTVIRAVTQSKLADMLLKPLEETLKKINYVGFLDINVIVDEKDGTPHPMEFTARPGYPMFSIMLSLIEGDPAQWMKDCINGKDTLKMIENTTCTGVVLVNSDFPWNAKEEESYLDFPILTDEVKDISHVHPCEVKLTKTIKMIDDRLAEDVPEWGTAGTFLVVCTGLGDTVTESKDAAYEVIKKVKVGNDAGYRKDIGEKCEDFLKKLHKHGFAKGWRYS